MDLNCDCPALSQFVVVRTSHSNSSAMANMNSGAPSPKGVISGGVIGKSGCCGWC